MKNLKNIFNVAITNIINFGTSFLINFMLPIILSVVDYGNYRQYILYMSFTYIFNAGFNDGIYIKYVFLVFWAAVDFCCCTQAFPRCGERGLLFAAVLRLLLAAASPVAGRGL